MDEDQVVKFVEAYLKKKGFKQAELAFQDELQHNLNAKSVDTRSDPDLSLLLQSMSQTEDSPFRYHDEYGQLRSWAYSSLDLYKHELLRVLYPVFVHSYMNLISKGHVEEAKMFFHDFRDDHEMLYSRDLQKFEGVLSPSHLEEMEFAHSIRHSRAIVKICQYSYDLLLQHLHKTESTLMLGIINVHLTFEVSAGPPSSISDDTDAMILIGDSQVAAGQLNKREIHWGVLESSLEDQIEKVGGLLPESERAPGDIKNGDANENKRRSIDGVKVTTPLKKMKRDRATGAGSKAAHPDSSAAFSSPRVKAELPVPVMYSKDANFCKFGFALSTAFSNLNYTFVVKVVEYLILN